MLKSLFAEAEKRRALGLLQSRLYPVSCMCPKPQTKMKLAVAMSGGIDSSTVLLLLSQYWSFIRHHLHPLLAHHCACRIELHPLYLFNWNPLEDQENIQPTQKTSTCPAERDFRDVEKTCQLLSTRAPMRLDMRREYWNRIFQPLCESYAEGKTPNGDVACNRLVKLGGLMQLLDQRFSPRMDFIVTGHYVKLNHELYENGQNNQNNQHSSKFFSVSMKRADDRLKDQSYFLSTVHKSTLQRCLTPLGNEWTKKDVYAFMQLHSGVLSHVLERRESMGLCYIEQKQDFSVFLSDYVEGQYRKWECFQWGSGQKLNIQQVDPRFWQTATIGQVARIPGHSVKWYIAQKNVKLGKVIVAPEENHPALYTDHVQVDYFYWLKRPELDEKLFVTFRSTDKQGSLLSEWHIGIESRDLHDIFEHSDCSKFSFSFKEPQRALALGQYVVVYNSNDECLGGGIASQVQAPFSNNCLREGQ